MRTISILLLASLGCGGGGDDGTGGGDGGGGGGGDGRCESSPQGIGSFAEHPIDTVLEHGQQLALADMDGDGALDVLAASSLDDTVYLYLHGCENWTRIAIADPGTLVATGVIPLDVDGDGDLDVVAAEPFDRASGENARLYWFENPGSVEDRFTEHLLHESATGLYRLDLVDIDGAGTLDLVVRNSSYADGVTWYRHSGTGLDGPFVIDDSIETVHSLTAGDVDGDGDVDLIAAASEGGDIRWYENLPSAGAEGRSFNAHAVATAEAPYGLVLANLDADEDLELVTSDGASLVAYDHGGTPAGAWARSELIGGLTSGAGHYIVAGDVNGSGTLDLVVADAQAGAGLRTLLRAENGITSQTVAENYPGFNELRIADIDGDGDLDLLTSTYEYEDGSDRISWWENRP